MRRFVALTLASLPLIAAASGCGDAPEGGDAPAIDSTLVEVLADLHLADARAALDTTARDPDRLADSLRRRAHLAHDLDSAALADQLDDLADDPARLRATYDALDTRLSLERQGVE